MPEINIPEQRKSKRFKIPDAIVITPDNVCQLVNISTGGLSFKCFLEVDLPAKCTVDIMVAGSDFHIEQLPVELIWKTLDDHSSYLSIPEEKVGVKFGHLDQSQGAKLEYLLSQY